MSTYFALIFIGLPGNFVALNVKAVRGSSKLSALAFGSPGLMVKGPATIPSPVSTSAWPLDPADDPRRGISFRAWKFRGLRPRTTIGAVVASRSTALLPFARVATILRWSTKCCCNSFLLPLLAVALYMQSSWLARHGGRRDRRMGDPRRTS